MVARDIFKFYTTRNKWPKGLKSKLLITRTSIGLCLALRVSVWEEMKITLHNILQLPRQRPDRRRYLSIEPNCTLPSPSFCDLAEAHHLIDDELKMIIFVNFSNIERSYWPLHILFYKKFRVSVKISYFFKF